ncbi:MAG: 50S ribosomal protein L30 [Chloroflexi bacterium]|jgi:large subunit ribosomal protein L30|nr:50S ribosomal protein L30 [Chloroflexota bacterium]MDL1883453.1 50S ribosomal protein L30 [Anaerolineae bacterium CFX8]GIL14769.1 MAG: 50S ribosomal protein L30 [Chloroflexota bacterium]
MSEQKKMLRVTLRRSLIGYEQSQRDTVRSLGLRRINHEVTVPDTPQVRGMLFKVRHLVEVEEVADETA